MRLSHFALIILLALVSTSAVKALNQSPKVPDQAARQALMPQTATLLQAHLQTQLTTPRRLADVDVTLPRLTRQGFKAHQPKGPMLTATMDASLPVSKPMPSAQAPTHYPPLSGSQIFHPSNPAVQASAKPPVAEPKQPLKPLDNHTQNALKSLARPLTSPGIPHPMVSLGQPATTVPPIPQPVIQPGTQPGPAQPVASRPATNPTQPMFDAKTRQAMQAVANPLDAQAFLAISGISPAPRHGAATPKMPLTAAQAAEADKQQAQQLTRQQAQTPQQPPKAAAAKPVVARKPVLTGRKLPNGLTSRLAYLHPANQIKLPRLALNHSQIIRLNQQSQGINMLAMAASPIPYSPYIALRPPHAESMVLKTGISNEKSLDLVVGKSRVINLPFPVARVAVSNPAVAQALVISPTQLQLVGKMPGLTNLTLWNSPADSSPLSYDLNVRRDVSQLAKQLKQIDPNISISALAADNAVILTGEVDSAEVAQTAVDVAKAYFGSGSNAAAASGSGGSGGGGGAAPTASGSGSGASGSSSASSLSLGSSVPLAKTPNVVNMLKVKGRPSSKMALVRQKLLAIDPNIEMDIVPGPNGTEKVILTGRVKSASTVSRAINTASIFYGEPGFKVLTGPGGNAIKSTTDANFQGDNAFSSNLDTNILQGSVITDASGNVVSMMQVAERTQIRCSIKILDISRRDLNQLGSTFSAAGGKASFSNLSGSQSTTRPFVDLNPDQSGNAVQSARNSGGSGQAYSNFNSLTQTYRNGLTQVFTLNQMFNASLSAFIEKRNIKTLAEPTMTMLSGEKGSFLAGGEIPIPVSANNGQISVEFKEFGIRLNMIPTLQEDGKIHMQIAPEVSEVDPSITIVTNNINIPGFRKRRMQTTLELENKQAFVLAGLFNRSSVDVLSKFPGMGNLPVVGSLFRQKNGEKTDNEMIVIIQPEIVTTGNSSP
jgi:Flp pilus assembly secretin CpaC